MSFLESTELIRWISSLELGVIRDNRTGLDRVVSHVESQLGLSFIGILPMAIEAILRQDRPNVAIEVKGRRRGRRGTRQSVNHSTSRQ